MRLLRFQFTWRLKRDFVNTFSQACSPSWRRRAQLDSAGLYVRGVKAILASSTMLSPPGRILQGRGLVTTACGCLNCSRRQWLVAVCSDIRAWKLCQGRAATCLRGPCPSKKPVLSLCDEGYDSVASAGSTISASSARAAASTP